MGHAGVRIGVVGATGALGVGLLEALGESALRVAQVAVVGSERSLGTDVEFQGDLYPVLVELPDPSGLDLLFLCAPPEVSREAAREALRAGVPAIDLSGATAAEPEVPLRIADLGEGLDPAAPLVATPSGPALALALVLHALAERAGLVRVWGVLLESAAAGGQRGTEALMNESLALFTQQDPPDPTVFARPVAFDCGPGAGNDSAREQQVTGELGRLLGSDVGFSFSCVQVPTFHGLGASLHVETRRPLAPAEAAAALAKAPGVAVWSDEVAGPSLRAAVGRAEVLVGRLREDPTVSSGLRLWLATDPVCLAAANAVRLAEARLRGR